MPSLTTENDSKPVSNPSPTMDDPANAPGPLGQALQIVEKKVRNLEKRKSKLDGYREINKKGKPLNEDQKVAISKYDEVAQNLDFARDLSNQFKTLALDEDKARKKMNKKEKQEKAKGDVMKVASALEIQDLLKSLANPKVKSDFLSGSNGATKLSKDQLATLETFSMQVHQPTRSSNNSEQSAFEKAAEHLVSVIEGKGKKFNNTKHSYKDLKNWLHLVKNCGYLAGVAMQENEEDEAFLSTPEGEQEDQPVEPASQENGQFSAPPVINAAPTAMSAPAPTSSAPPAREQPKPRREPAINFLQDSEIDMESPHMDPAVVVVHNTPPHSMAVNAPGLHQTFNNQMYMAPMQQQPQHLAHSQSSNQPRPTRVKDVQQLSGPKRGAPGFPEIPAQQPQAHHMPESAAPHDVHREPGKVDSGANPTGFGTMTFDNSEKDTFANISEWDEGNANRGQERSGSGRGNRGGRGRGGRGNGDRPRGAGSDRRGGRRDDREGGRPDRDREGGRGGGRGFGDKERRGGGRGGMGGGERRRGNDRGRGGRGAGFGDRSQVNGNGFSH